MENQQNKENMTVSSFIRKAGVKNLAIIGVCGAALIVLSVFPIGENKGSKESDEGSAGNVTAKYDDYSYEQEYVESLESRLSSTLNKIPGAGPVTVMITLKSSSEQVVLKDTDSQSENSTQQEGDVIKNNSSSSDSESVVTFENDQGDVPYVIERIEPKIEGILIITGENATAKIITQISDAAQALFGVEAHKIKVIKGN